LSNRIKEDEKYELSQKIEKKRPLGRLTHSWEDNIKMDLQEAAGFQSVDWIHVGQVTVQM
jgi:hypothetical protein